MNGVDDPTYLYGPDPFDGDRSYEHGLAEAVAADPFAAMDTLRRQDDQIKNMQRVIREYAEDVSDGARFDALLKLVPGLASDDGTYGDIGANIRDA